MVVCGGVMFVVPIVTHYIAGNFLNLLWFIVIPHFRKLNKFVFPVCTCGISPVVLVCTSVLSRRFLCYWPSAVFRARTSRPSCDQHRTHSVRAHYHLDSVFELIGILLTSRWNLFIAASNSCVMCNSSYFTLHSYYLYICFVIFWL
jgi:hypothetical protein